MAFVSKLPIFVSYAIQDDEGFLGQRGWISKFIIQLHRALDRLLGRTDEYLIYKDDARRSAPDFLTPHSGRALEQSAAPMIFMSPNYLKSLWCRKEAEVFLERLHNETHDPRHRVFIDWAPPGASPSPGHESLLIDAFGLVQLAELVACLKLGNEGLDR